MHCSADTLQMISRRNTNSTFNICVADMKYTIQIHTHILMNVANVFLSLSTLPSYYINMLSQDPNAIKCITWVEIQSKLRGLMPSNNDWSSFLSLAMPQYTCYHITLYRSLSYLMVSYRTIPYRIINHIIYEIIYHIVLYYASHLTIM